MELSNKKVFITGGGSGIGKALIEVLSEKGVTAIAVMGRGAEKLDALEKAFPSVHFLKIQGDVSKQADLQNAIANIEEEWGALDILINNAGVVSAGLLSQLSDEDIIDQIDINLKGLILGTKYALPLLKKSEEGAIINVSSGLGYIAMPYYSVYAATKAAVKHFSEALRRELHDDPIHVMTLYPTTTDTDMMKTAKTGKMDSPEMVAQQSIEGLLNKEIEVIFGGQQRIDDIKTNFEEPGKIDEKAKQNFASLKERAENHRAM